MRIVMCLARSRFFPIIQTQPITRQTAPRRRLPPFIKRWALRRAAIFQASCHGPDNRAMMDALATSPQTYRSVCISNDSFSDKDFADLDAGGVHQPAFQILRQFIERDNWWVKICGSERISAAGPPFYDAVPYAQELVEIAPDRILWGTDWPHPNIKKHMPNDGDLLDLVPLLARDTALQKKILVDNTTRLYGFDGASQ